MEIFKRQFGVRLRAARKRVIPKMSQALLASRVGVEPPSVSRWETGKDFPEDHRLPAICEALGVIPAYFENESPTIPSARAVEKVPDTIEFLTKFSKLSPARRDLVLAVAYDDESKIADGDEADWPQWLSERLARQST